MICKGFCSSDIIDHHWQKITPKVIIAAIPQYIRNGAKICLDHNKNIIIGKLLELQVQPIDEFYTGVYIATKIFDEYVENISSMIENKQLTGFSIGGDIIEKEISYPQKTGWTNILAYDLQEISIVGRPCNPLALIAKI